MSLLSRALPLSTIGLVMTAGIHYTGNILVKQDIAQTTWNKLMARIDLPVAGLHRSVVFGG